MRSPARLALAVSCAVVVVAAAAALPAGAATDPIANSGFESGLSGWSCPATASSNAGNAHSGGFALRAAPTAGDTAQCTQTVAVAASTRYTMTAWVNGSYVYVGASGTGGSDASSWTPGTGGAYQQLSVAFTTGAATTSVTVFVHGWYGQSAYYADDFALSGGASTPSPTVTSAGPSPSPSASRTPTPTPTPTASGGPGARLPACPFFTNVTPPVRTAGPSHDSVTKGPLIDLGGRLPAPTGVTGSLSGASVTITFARVAGATAYRVWRNSQSVAWVDDWGQATLSVTDSAPCRSAHYTVVALRSDASDASTGQLSRPYILADSGVVQPYAIAPGTQYTWMVTSYNDAGQTASGYSAGLGICAVDTRYIPWGTRFKVDGYGYCYAADIGTWIQGQIVDIWLPGSEAGNWGVQTRTITIQ
jgi:3D (Asp-Asp-Asp) domain-containing protein